MPSARPAIAKFHRMPPSTRATYQVAPAVMFVFHLQNIVIPLVDVPDSVHVAASIAVQMANQTKPGQLVG